jgi:hypothetical protein
VVTAPQATNAACTLEPGPISGTSYVLQPPDAFTAVAWKIPMSSCTACPSPAALDLKTVSFRVRWFGACTATAEISIVGAQPGPGCLVPDPTQVLCGPVSYSISGTAAGGVVYTLPTPSGCCVSGDAFIVIRFGGFDQCVTPSFAPGLTATLLPCVNCEEYYTSTVSAPSFTDWCSFPSAMSLWLSVDADCCIPTPALRHSWGTLKTRYH